jgi:hypothetical protein
LWRPVPFCPSPLRIRFRYVNYCIRLTHFIRKLLVLEDETGYLNIWFTNFS